MRKIYFEPVPEQCYVILEIDNAIVLGNASYRSNFEQSSAILDRRKDEIG
jgi:hypothetical protein